MARMVMDIRAAAAAVPASRGRSVHREGPEAMVFRILFQGQRLIMRAVAAVLVIILGQRHQEARVVAVEGKPAALLAARALRTRVAAVAAAGSRERSLREVPAVPGS